MNLVNINTNKKGEQFMRARDTNNSVPIAKSGRIEDACLRYGVGKNTMRSLANEAHAVMRVGRIYLINYSKMDAYMDTLTEA